MKKLTKSAPGLRASQQAERLLKGDPADLGADTQKRKNSQKGRFLRADQVKALREAKGMTQQQLADAIGVHWITISKIERGIMKRTSYMPEIQSVLEAPNDNKAMPGLNEEAIVEGLRRVAFELSPASQYWLAYVLAE